MIILFGTSKYYQFSFKGDCARIRGRLMHMLKNNLAFESPLVGQSYQLFQHIR